MGQENIGTALLHEIHHPLVHDIPFCLVRFNHGLFVKGVVLVVVETLPVPDADLVLGEPLGGVIRFGSAGKAIDDQLNFFPLVSLGGIPQRPEGT